jgi:site-specific recombinase XerD
MTTPADFPQQLEKFFTDRLMKQRQASPNTISSYRDTFRLLVRFASEQLKKAPSMLNIKDLNAPFICRFLDHLETDRGNSARTRNVRLAAIHSFFQYVAFELPEHSALVQRVLAIPNKAFESKPIEFLSEDETKALLEAPNTATHSGQRDRALLMLAVESGLRASELIGLRCQDVTLGSGAHIRCLGKGRKERCTPLSTQLTRILHDWLQLRQGCPSDPLFPNARGQQLSRDGLAYILDKHLAVARLKCPSLRKKKVTPHVLRHTAAMRLLQQGVDRSVIALWLGHESMETTQAYLHADLNLKENALNRTKPLDALPGRYKPDDSLLAFLEAL